MLSVFRNMFRIPDLRRKIFFTLFIFLVYRVGTAIPSPGSDPGDKAALPLDRFSLFDRIKLDGGIEKAEKDDAAGKHQDVQGLAG